MSETTILWNYGSIHQSREYQNHLLRETFAGTCPCRAICRFRLSRMIQHLLRLVSLMLLMKARHSPSGWYKPPPLISRVLWGPLGTVPREIDMRRLLIPLWKHSWLSTKYSTLKLASQRLGSASTQEVCRSSQGH